MTAARYRSKPLAAVRRAWRRLMAPPALGVTRVLIVGAGDAGQHLGWQLRNGSLAESYYVVGHVDDDGRKHGMLIHGHKVLGGRQMIPEIVESRGVDLIVIAIHLISGPDFRDIVALCQETTAQIKLMPNALAPMHGDSFQAPLTGGSLFGDLTFEDLLGRHAVTIDHEQCRHLVRGKTVLVTGASGSIGSELCRHLAELSPGPPDYAGLERERCARPLDRVAGVPHRRHHPRAGRRRHHARASPARDLRWRAPEPRVPRGGVQARAAHGTVP